MCEGDYFDILIDLFFSLNSLMLQKSLFINFGPYQLTANGQFQFLF